MRRATRTRARARWTGRARLHVGWRSRGGQRAIGWRRAMMLRCYGRSDSGHRASIPGPHLRITPVDRWGRRSLPGPRPGMPKRPGFRTGKRASPSCRQGVWRGWPARWTARRRRPGWPRWESAPCRRPRAPQGQQGGLLRRERCSRLTAARRDELGVGLADRAARHLGAAALLGRGLGAAARATPAWPLPAWPLPPATLSPFSPGLAVAADPAPVLPDFTFFRGRYL